MLDTGLGRRRVLLGLGLGLAGALVGCGTGSTEEAPATEDTGRATPERKPPAAAMDILLIAGLWLDGSTVWRDVARDIEALGHRAVPVRLPGLGDGNTAATLDDQVAAVLAAVDGAAGRPMMVGHSAAASLAWIAADARPDKVAVVALVGGFPARNGDPYAELFPIKDGAMAFPGWAPFQGPDSSDLDDAAKQTFAASAIPVPAGVATGVVRLADERRYDVPVVMVCPEFTPAQAKAWVAGGRLPELAKVKRLSYLDIDSGHWPMVSAPTELARLLATATEQT